VFNGTKIINIFLNQVSVIPFFGAVAVANLTYLFIRGLNFVLVLFFYFFSSAFAKKKAQMINTTSPIIISNNSSIID